MIRMGQMKTTVEISDSLLEEVRKLGAREGVTLRALVERGLYRVVADTTRTAPFKLRRASFKGLGVQAEFRGAAWDRLRDGAYATAARDRGITRLPQPGRDKGKNARADRRINESQGMAWRTNERRRRDALSQSSRSG
jgi:hypothetical protein